MNQVLYLYCFTRANAAIPRTVGLSDQGELLAYRFEDLAAVFQWTKLELWSGPDAQAQLQDLEWLGPRVVRHQRAIEAVMRSAPVLPARLGTLFSSPSALERFLVMHRRTIRDFLGQVEARDEWAVKGLVDRAKAEDWLCSRLVEQHGAAPPAAGMRYLHERRMRTAAARELNRWVVETLEPVIEELRGYATDSRQRGVISNPQAGEPQPIVNLAFLVARDRVADFRRCVERAGREHDGRGLELGMSGPWPPYSFCPVLEMPS